MNHRYALAAAFKSGGMADVHRATDLLHESQRPVAVKLLRTLPLADEILRESFRREELQGRTRHGDHDTDEGR
jgi:hypothetical protein